MTAANDSPNQRKLGRAPNQRPKHLKHKEQATRNDQHHNQHDNQVQRLKQALKHNPSQWAGYPNTTGFVFGRDHVAM